MSGKPGQRARETAAGLRAMAARARRLAGTVLDQQTITGLTEFAAELEIRATTLETACGASPRVS